MGKYEAQFQSQPRGFERDSSPPRNFGLPPPMQGRGYFPPRNFGRGGSPPPMHGRSRSPPPNFGRGGSPPRERGRSRSPPRGGAGPHMRDQPGNFGPPPRQQQLSRYGPPPQQRNDGPPPGRGPPPRRDDYRGRGLSPRRREQSPRRFDDRGPRQVNAVAQGRDMQADPNTVEWILDSGSQANVCGDLSLFTTLREDKTNKLDFANGKSEHASICGSVLLQITNLATGELEDRLLETWCTYRPGTTLKFVMTAKIYRLRVKKVTDVMVMAAVKGKMDSKKSMELLHQRFGHMGMSTVKLLANKLDVGIDINAKDLSSYDCVACAAGKAKRMSYARIPVRKSKPLETLMMDI
ncbi:hypothetical protein PR003_g26636, partial [Phytophthora rubi]